MYEFVDRPVTSLDPGGRFLVWSMRSWVNATGEKRCSATALQKAFARWNMDDGLPPFLQMMTAFNRHGRETLQFCPLQCNHVSEHEAIILSLVCDLRGRHPQALCNALALLVKEEAIGELSLSLSVLGRALEDAAIFPTRDIRATRGSRTGRAG